MEEYVRSFKELKGKLASLGAQVPSGMLIQGMLNGLSTTYDNLIQGIG